MNKAMRKNYKYHLLVTILMLILAFVPAYSQKGLQAGLTLGVQNTLLKSKSSSEINALNVFCPLVSADIAYGLFRNFAIQSGFGYTLYSQRTSKFRNNFNYLSVPLYVKIGGFRTSRKFMLDLFGGPNFKFLLSANNMYQNDKQDISYYTKGFHRDYTFGFGMKYLLDNHLLIEAHLTGTLWGGTFNRTSFDGFFLRNQNYGMAMGIKYRF